MPPLEHSPIYLQNPSTHETPIHQIEAQSPLLPSIEDKSRKTLVLDLDQTLVFSSFQRLPTYDFTLDVQRFDKIGTVYVRKRPGVDEFIVAMAKIFELVVFTAGTKAYADPVLNKLDPDCTISHRLYRDSCQQREDGFVKDLSMLGRGLEKVVIVDDDPRCYSLQPENAMPVGPFSDNLKDHELLDLIPVLESAAEQSNVTEFLRMKRGEESKSWTATRSSTRAQERWKSSQYRVFLHDCFRN